MKKPRKICLIAALALLLALSTGAQAALYVEGLLGGNAASNLGDSSARVLAGWRLGYWFVPEGVLGMHYPNWMKYLGVYTDITWNQVRVSQGSFQTTVDTGTWAFMAAARYGFFPDQKVPFGRLQPWVGIGFADFFYQIQHFLHLESIIGPGDGCRGEIHAGPKVLREFRLPVPLCPAEPYL